LGFSYNYAKLQAIKIMKKYLCLICGLIYDESLGWPDDDIKPGTKWEDIPENWACPDCGASKEDFDMIEIT
jgi:rubredoxin